MSLIAGVPVLILIGTMEDGPLMRFGVELVTPSVVLLILEMAPWTQACIWVLPVELVEPLWPPWLGAGDAELWVGLVIILRLLHVPAVIAWLANVRWCMLTMHGGAWLRWRMMVNGESESGEDEKGKSWRGERYGWFETREEEKKMLGEGAAATSLGFCRAPSSFVIVFFYICRVFGNDLLLGFSPPTFCIH